MREEIYLPLTFKALLDTLSMCVHIYNVCVYVIIPNA